MKTKWRGLAWCVAFIAITLCYRGGDSSRRITISGAWALYPMMITWSEEYRKTTPNLTIDVSAGGAGKGVTDVLSGVVDIGMVSRQITSAESRQGAWYIGVAKDAVVPVINDRNPWKAALTRRGLTRKEFSRG